VPWFLSPNSNLRCNCIVYYAEAIKTLCPNLLSCERLLNRLLATPVKLLEKTLGNIHIQKDSERVTAPGGAMSGIAVRRIDPLGPETLQPFGRLDGFPRNRRVAGHVAAHNKLFHHEAPRSSSRPL